MVLMPTLLSALLSMFGGPELAVHRTGTLAPPMAGYDRALVPARVLFFRGLKDLNSMMAIGVGNRVARDDTLTTISQQCSLSY